VSRRDNSRSIGALSRVLTMMLIGLGAAIFLRTVMEVGFDGLRSGHLVGPALVAAGVARLRLAAVFERDEEGR